MTGTLLYADFNAGHDRGADGRHSVRLECVGFDQSARGLFLRAGDAVSLTDGELIVPAVMEWHPVHGWLGRYDPAGIRDVTVGEVLDALWAERAARAAATEGVTEPSAPVAGAPAT